MPMEMQPSRDLYVFMGSESCFSHNRIWFLNFIYLFIFGYAECSLLHAAFLELHRVGLLSVAVPGLLTGVASLVMEQRL